MRDDEVVCSVTSSATRNLQSEINDDILSDRRLSYAFVGN